MKNETAFVPKRLLEARLASGLSRTSLADACQLSAQSVSSYETGLRVPSPNTLRLLADNLMVPIRYFLAERKSDTGVCGTTFFRSQWSARTRREYDRRSQTAIWAGEVGAWVDTYVGLPSIALPELNVKNEYGANLIEELASHLRLEWGAGTGPIGNIVRLIESKGIVVVKQTFESNKVDAFSRIVLGRPYIFLSHNKSSFVRSRFDAAHELGHLLLHQHVTNADLERPGVLKKIENEANLFAAAFLMPASSFAREIYGSTLQSFINLKPRWKVSVQSMILRAAELGVITESQKASLMIQISAKGMRVIEPLDKELKAEDPVLLRKAWELITDNHVRPPSAICEDLALRPEFVASILHVPCDKLIGEVEISNIIPFSLKPIDQSAAGYGFNELPFAG